MGAKSSTKKKTSLPFDSSKKAAVLKHAEAAYRYLFETMTQGVVFQDAEGKIIAANPAAEKLLGVSLDQLQGRTSYDSRWHAIKEDGSEFSGDSHPSMEALRTGKTIHNVVMGVWNPGTGIHRWFNIHAVPLFLPGETTPYQVFTTFEDISDSKQTKQALEDQNQLMRTLLDNLQVGVFMVEAPSGKPLLANNRAEELLGRGVIADAERSNLAEVYQAYRIGTDALYPQDQLPIVRSMAGEKVAIEDMEVVHPNGKRVPLEVHASPVADSHGRIVASLSSFLDISKRKRAEEALRMSEERLKAIFEATPDPVVVYDNKGRPQYLNPVFTDVFGWTLEELKGHRIPFVPTDQEKRTAEIIKEIYASNRPVRFITNRLTKQGDSVEVIISAATIKGPDGEAVGVVVTLTDISGQRNLEAQLQQAQKMESIGRLAGGVAHDFNNMLGVILGHTELAMEQVDAASPVYNDLDEIKSAVRRSTDLIRQLLAFARRQAADPKVLDLNDIIPGMLKMLRRLIGEDIELTWSPGNNLWPVKIDPAQIDQILANLCVNARDSIAGVGQITIETSNVVLDEAYCANHESLVPGQYVLLVVGDDGCGMEKSILEKVFEPFFTTKDVGQGTGLGLATVYGIIKQNKGFIDLASEPGTGSTFELYFPRNAEEALTIKADESSRAFEKGHETILLVEDEEAILGMTAKILERLGYTVKSAATPRQAIQICNHPDVGHIDLLITDVIMPEMNGRDLSANLQRLYPDMKCLFMSGYTADVIALHGVLEQGVEFLHKPFTKQELAAKVRAVLDQDDAKA